VGGDDFWDACILHMLGVGHAERSGRGSAHRGRHRQQTIR
jgi:hypothetical protein